MSANNPILDDLETRIAQEMQSPAPVLDKLEDLEQEVENIMRSIFAQWDLEDQDRLRTLRKQLRTKINDLVNATPPSGSIPPSRQAGSVGSAAASPAGTPGGSGSAGQGAAPGGIPGAQGVGSTPPARDPQAENLMNQAEAAFYAGKYSDAIRLYEQVLMIEHNWPRAEEHFQQAQEYLQTGNIPAHVLPAEAAIWYGKAQSAVNVMDYERAMTLYEEAKKVLRAEGITRFQEGQEFEKNTQALMDAQNKYNEGIQAFQTGNLDEAIQKMQVAVSAAPVPLYQDKLTEYRDVQSKLEQIGQKLFTRPITLQLVEEAKAELDRLRAKYGAHPLLEQMSIPERQALGQAVEHGLYGVERKVGDAQRTPRIEDASTFIEDAARTLSTLENAWPGGEEISRQLSHVRTRLNKEQTKNEEAQELLDRANTAFATNDKTRARELLRTVQSLYPLDPEVDTLSAKLAPYEANRSRLLTIGGVIGALIIIIIGIWGWGRFQNYQLSLTPTPTFTFTPTSTTTLTPTPTLTPTSTSTFTPTPTFTLTPTPTFTVTPTFTPTLTPTPMTMRAIRRIWVRNDCYESYTAIGSIPAAGVVQLLPAERRLDNLNRECVLVEYKGIDSSYTGWVLLADLTLP